ncbi:MAG: DUF4097 family beta strand repeat-containing protein [Bacteroidota bacterium]
MLPRLLAPLLLLLVALPATAQNGTVYLDETFDASAIDDLFVDLSAEDVIVEALGGSGEARVTITGRGRDADEVFERKRYSAAMQGDRLVVRSDPERRMFNWGSWNASFTVVVRVPVEIDALIDVSSGDVRIDELSGDRLVVDLSSGDVTLGTITADEIVVDSSSGDLDADRLEADEITLDCSSGDYTIGTAIARRLSYDASSGDLEIRDGDIAEFIGDTSSGDLEVGGILGSARVDLSSGSAELGIVKGQLSASASSGDIRARLDLSSEAVVETSSGSITLAAPAGMNADVRLEGGSIRLAEGFAFTGEIERDEARGRLGSGGNQLVASSNSGRVTLRAE